MIKYFKLLNNREFYWTAIFQIATLLGGIIFIKVLAFTLEKEDYGFYALITSVSALILSYPFTALAQGISRFASVFKVRNQLNPFISNTSLLFLLIITGYLIIAVCFYQLIDLNIYWDNNFYLIVIYIISEIIKVYFRTLTNALRERKIIALSVIIEFIFKICLIALSHIFVVVTIPYVLTALLLGNLIGSANMIFNNREFIVVKSINKKNFIHSNLKVWQFSYPLLIWAIFGWLRDMSNRWYLDIFVNKEQVALFSMVGSLALVGPMALQGIIGSYYVPILYEKENKDAGYTLRYLKKMIPILLFFFLGAFFIVYFFKNFLVVVLADKKYLSVSWMLPWMFLTYSFYVTAMISTSLIFVKKRTSKLNISSILPGIISVVFGYFFVKNYGIEGALYNYIITYLSYAILTFIVVYRFSKKQ